MANSTFMSPALLRKTRGFVDFDLQMKRPMIEMPKAHDRRFDSFNNFPRILSDHKPVRNIDFDRMKDRDEVVYRDTKCSDSLYDHSQLNYIKKKHRGILHFGQSVIERDTKVILEPENTTQACHCRNPNRFSQKDST